MRPRVCWVLWHCCVSRMYAGGFGSWWGGDKRNRGFISMQTELKFLGPCVNQQSWCDSVCYWLPNRHMDQAYIYCTIPGCPKKFLSQRGWTNHTCRAHVLGPQHQAHQAHHTSASPDWLLSQGPQQTSSPSPLQSPLCLWSTSPPRSPLQPPSPSAGIWQNSAQVNHGHHRLPRWIQQNVRVNHNCQRLHKWRHGWLYGMRFFLFSLASWWALVAFSGCTTDIHVHALPEQTPPSACSELPLTDWGPFKDAAHFLLTDFLFHKVQMSNSNITELLEYWTLSVVKNDAAAPYDSCRSLYTTIDAIQYGDALWQCMSALGPRTMILSMWPHGKHRNITSGIVTQV